MRAYRATPEGGAKIRATDRERAVKPLRAAATRASVKKYNATPAGRVSLKKADRKWKSSNKIKILARERARRAANPLFKLACNSRRMIRLAIQKRGYQNQTKTQGVLGCEFEILRTHLERQFKPEMSWSNFGEWNIDHIIPVSSGMTTDEVLALNHYSNLQPMWSRYNKLKQDMMPDEWQQYIEENEIDLAVRPNKQAVCGAVCLATSPPSNAVQQGVM